ncbi:hypothetical protein [Bradyrhizobium sp. USDA 4503]
MQALGRAKHGEREEVLAKVDRSVDLNTIRREIKGLTFLDTLGEKDSKLCAHLQASSFNVIEVLARWYDFDQRGAVRAAAKVASDGYSWASLQLAMRQAKKQLKVPTRETSIAQAKPEIVRQIHLIFGSAITLTAMSRPKANLPPVDLLLSITRSEGYSESVAALIVGPYRNATIYSKRRRDELLRAMGLAWIYDHIILVLPTAANLPEYKHWLAEYVGGQLRSSGDQASTDQIRRPSVHIISINAE